MFTRTGSTSLGREMPGEVSLSVRRADWFRGLTTWAARFPGQLSRVVVYASMASRW